MNQVWIRINHRCLSVYELAYERKLGDGAAATIAHILRLELDCMNREMDC